MASGHILGDLMLVRALRRRKMKSFTGYAVLMIFLLSLFLAALATFYITAYRPDMMKESLPALFWTRFYIAIPSSLLINGTICGIRFYQEHSRIGREHARLQQAHLESRIELLRNQVNPHVMFNVLNHIFILVQQDTDQASFLLLKFSDVLRYQLYECNRSQVTLAREIQYLQDFTAVEQLRWGGELGVSCSWQITDGSLAIAPLLLIPFVENAFKHVYRSEGHRGYIRIDCLEEGALLQLVVENSYSDAMDSKPETSRGIGLRNVQQRLRLQYPEAHDLIIAASGSVFKIRLTLQLKK